MTTSLIRMACFAGLIVQFSTSLAAVNPITVTFNNGTTDFPTSTAGTANYIVTVNAGVVPSNVPLTFSLTSAGSSAGLMATQLTSGASPCMGVSKLCANPFSLKAGENCCLAFSLTSTTAGSYTIQPSISTIPAAYPAKALSALPINVTATPGTTALSISKSTLALSVKNTGLNAALTGNPRILTIKNTGDKLATGLTISYPTWPMGTSALSTCTTTLAPNATCIITITPGQNATAGAGNAACSTGIEPTPGIINISANNASTIQSGVVVLSYGCIYQGGYVYSVDDAAPISRSIDGKVVQLNDASSGILWDSSSGCINAPYNQCYKTNANSNSNGTNLLGGNTYLIYQVLTTTHAELATSYAAGLCTGTFSGYSDWYLPAICEMGYDSTAQGTGCGLKIAPTLQNMQSNLVDYNSLNLLTGHYWSSTEESTNPTVFAWDQFFSFGSGSYQDRGNKGLSIVSVRCSRALTS